MKPWVIRSMTLAGGVLATLGFAPWQFWPVTLLSLMLLGLFWQTCPSAKSAFALGWWWGMGFFCAGTSWLNVSLHDFGGMSTSLSFIVIGLLGAFLALFPAFTGLLSWYFRPVPLARWLLATPALWTLSEWVRSWIFTGFPWLSLGYAQVPGPLAGYIPIVGVFGASLITLLIVGCALLVILRFPQARAGQWLFSLLIPAILLLGVALKTVAWTHPVGQALSVDLLQGNIPQDMKFLSDSRGLILQRYNHLLFNSTGRLILLPESALPYIRQHMPDDYTESLESWGYDHNSDILIGMFSEPEREQYYNSVFSFGHSPMQAYHKVHLVPFGEFIPFEAWLAPIIHNVLHIPLDGQQSGDAHQPPLRVAGQWVGVNICYEDAFGDEVRTLLPQATLLANFTNDGWFGSSVEPEQHLQMAQARSLETGRPMLRVTNTGVSAIIGAHGEVLARAPREEIIDLNGLIWGYRGTTPFVFWGNYGILAVCFIALALSMRRRSPS